MRTWLLILLLVLPATAGAAEIPPAPSRFLTDTAGFVSPAARLAIDQRLEAYQSATGHQVVVWIGDSLGGDDLADWAVRTFAAWKVGRRGADDGVALFIFAADRTIDIEVGYGLEDQLTDARARQIIDAMGDPLRAGDRDTAVAGAVEAILEAIEGKPFPGGTVAPARAPAPDSRGPTMLYVVLAIVALVVFVTNPRLATMLLWNIAAGGGGGGFRGGGGGGGGFSGGGGRSGGGGARGSW